MRWIVVLAGILGMIGVAVGAFAAHGLEPALSEQGIAPEDIAERLDQCDVAVRYHLTHTLALLVIGFLSPTEFRWRRTFAALFLLLGILLFSGGLYSMVFLGEMGHWAIVPSGGLCFLLGWLWVATLGWYGKAATE
jgi:uncharacterized membrane protein YgdD (TMEM256/DUF423 family)